jgi:hypothetical protein
MESQETGTQRVAPSFAAFVGLNSHGTVYKLKADDEMVQTLPFEEAELSLIEESLGGVMILSTGNVKIPSVYTNPTLYKSIVNLAPPGQPIPPGTERSFELRGCTAASIDLALGKFLRVAKTVRLNSK